MQYLLAVNSIDIIIGDFSYDLLKVTFFLYSQYYLNKRALIYIFSQIDFKYSMIFLSHEFSLKILKLKTFINPQNTHTKILKIHTHKNWRLSTKFDLQVDILSMIVLLPDKSTDQAINQHRSWFSTETCLNPAKLLQTIRRGKKMLLSKIISNHQFQSQVPSKMFFGAITVFFFFWKNGMPC